MEYYVVIPAAGMGKRMGAGKNKLFINLNDIPILIHTLQVFENDSWCKGIVLVVNSQDRQEMENLIQQYQLNKIVAIVDGGEERQHSVYAGLKALPEEIIVLVHDGARPFVKKTDIHRLVESAEANGAAVLAVPVKDTIKQVQHGMIEGTINRDLLWSAQTPQSFQIRLLVEAHEVANSKGLIGTDDASLVESMGKKVVIVQGDYDNIKITTPEDLFFAKAIISKNNQVGR